MSDKGETTAKKPASKREERARRSAQEVLDRAEREVRSLSATGMDVAALSDRFAAAKSRFDEDQYSECESLCGEILVLAKSMGAIASASKKAGRGGAGEKVSETLKLELSRIVASEVSNRLETAIRGLPTTSTIEEVVQTKIQEALVTGGLMGRLENIAAERAQSAVSSIPRFTAKDAQAAANLVVQRGLTQFLASKELGTRVKAAVEAEVGTALEEAMRRLTQETEALVNTRVASSVAPLPTVEKMKEHVDQSLNLFVKEEIFEERVLELAAERAKAEVQRAPDLMSDAAGRIARNEADALFKLKLQSPEFADQVRQLAHDASVGAISQQSMITPEDVEVISRRVADESLGSLAESEILKEKIERLANDVVSGAFGAEGLDSKVKQLAGALIDERAKDIVAQAEELTKSRPTREEIQDEIGKVRMDLMASQDFGEWIKDGVKTILGELGLAEGMAGLEKALVSPDKVEKIARHEALTAAMDLLETKEFTRRILALLDENTVKAKVEEISGGAVSPEQISQGAELQARNVFAEQLESPEFAEKINALTGGDKTKDLSKRLIERMDRIEKEALPAIVERLLTEKIGAATGDAIAEKVTKTVQEAVASQVNPNAMQEQILKIAQDNIKDIANTPGFKTMLDEKFKVMLNYLTKDVLPKQIKKIMGG